MDNLIGQLLGRYRLDALLGEGGMGEVYKAADVTLQRPVAIKVMHAHFARQADFQKRFLSEARTAAKLDHPGIVKVLDFGEAQSRLYIVMEFLSGGNLRQLLQTLRAEQKWIVLSEAVGVLRQICLALDYAHRQGVLHRDIKPDNIMLKPEAADGLPYRPVVTDLGLARLVSSEHLTQSGISMGTPAYMSPEQALGEETDARSDVYSLGVLLYELAVGRLPFPFKSVTEAIRYHSKEAPPPPPGPRSLRPDLPEAVEQVILRALEKDPAARFATAAQMAEALNALPAEAPTRTVLATPTGEMEAGVSLVTVLQAGTTIGRGESVLGEFPSPPSTISQDGVSILAPDHSIRRVPMKPDGLTIGRGAGADIALDDERVSRRHAQITFDGVNYQVTDLNSANGTYLSNFKLLPGVAQDWTPDKPLRAGGYYLRLEKRQALGDQTLRGKASVAGTLAQSTSSSGRVAVFLETTEFTVAPGGSVVLLPIVINQSEVVDHFSVSVQGVPKEWLPGPVPYVELLPGLQQQVALTIQPPRASTSRAGPYPLTLRVISKDAPDEFAEVNARLSVQAYHQASSQLAPEKVRANKPAQVSVRNLGNAPEAFQLTWRDQADEVLFTPAQAQLTVPEGQEVPAPFTARPKHLRWIGGEKQHPFVVQVSSAASEAQSQAGQLISRGLIPTWLPPLVVLLALLLCGTLYALFVKPPLIEAMVLTPSNPQPNERAVVSWQVSNCQSVELWDSTTLLAKDLPCTGNHTFEHGFPSTPHLSLVASNLFVPVIGKTTKTQDVALVTPTPLPTREPGPPVIEMFTIDPPAIVAGQSVNIRWKVSNADSVELKLGDLVNTVDSSGTMPDRPAQNRVYTLIAHPKATGRQPTERSQEVIVTPPTATPDAGATAVVAQATQQAAQATLQAQQSAAQATADANATQAAATAQQATQVAATATAAAQATAQVIAGWVGDWRNTNSSTSSWTRIQITMDGNTLAAHVWGACVPTACDAGTASTNYSGNPVSLVMNSGFATENFTLSLNGDVLHVTTLTHFTDNSGRQDYTSQDDFRRRTCPLIGCIEVAPGGILPKLVLPTATP